MDVKITFDRYNVIEADKINDVKVVMVKGEKGDVGYPTDAQVETAVDEWLTAHPEVTTTVQDGSITEAKLANDVKGMFDEKADAIIKTSSGDIASFTDGGNGLLVKSLIANITPKQSGSGDPSPSNVRPISGYEGVNVYDDPKYGGVINFNQLAILNELSTTTYRGITYTYDPTANTLTISGTATSTSALSLTGLNINLLTDHIYYLPNIRPSGSVGMYFVNGNYANYSGIFKMTRNENNRFLDLRYQSGVSPQNEVLKMNCQLFDLTQMFGETKAEEILAMGQTQGAEYFKSIFYKDYYPYNAGEETCVSAVNDDPYRHYSTSLGQTVYGGVLDVVSGKLTIIKNGVVYNGSESWGFTASSGRNRVNISLSGAPQGSYNLDIKGNYIKASSEASSLPLEWQGNINNLGALLIGVPTSITSADSWKSYLASNPLTVVYPLATPTEIQLTPTQVKTLLGNNNIWANSGTVEVEYRADTTLAYNELLSLIASLS